MGLTKQLEAMYPRMPLVVQNLMISGQGLLFRKQRFGTEFTARLAAASDRAQWPRDRLEQYQIEQLQAFLSHAAKTSPYWRKRLADINIEGMQSVADLAHVPILEKSALRSRTEEIASTSVERKRLLWSHTSGTTGTPITVAYTPEDMQERFATLYRMFAQFGIAPLTKSVRLSGRTLFPKARENGVFWRMNWAQSQMLMSSYDLHPDHLQAYVDQLQRFAPKVIDGYPSSIYILARFINQTGQSGRIAPNVIMTTAETLESYQRNEISTAFGGCPVVNQYASSEGAPFITQDPDGELVINTDSGVFEFVKPGTNTPASPGTLAEMLVTSFTTHAYPLIRYRIGDTVLLPQKPRRSRHWDMPVVEQILGRQEDILWTPERGYVGRLDPVFKKSPSTIIESQIVQTGPMNIALKVVPDKESAFDKAQLDGIKEELRNRLGAVEIDVEICDSLPRGTNGKLRAVIGLPGLAPQSRDLGTPAQI